MFLLKGIGGFANDWVAFVEEQPECTRIDNFDTEHKSAFWYVLLDLVLDVYVLLGQLQI